jgi:hypothetical protein
MAWSYPVDLSSLTPADHIGGAIMAQHIRTMSAKQAEVASAKDAREARKATVASREACS